MTTLMKISVSPLQRRTFGNGNPNIGWSDSTAGIGGRTVRGASCQIYGEFMKIGIDAKWYFSGNPSGKVVVRNLVDTLIGMSSGHEIYLFFQRRDEKMRVF